MLNVGPPCGWRRLKDADVPGGVGLAARAMLQFRVLGPLEVWVGAERLDLGGPKPRAMLAVLLVNANQVVSTDRLIDELWGEAPPPTARNLIQCYVSRVRRVLRGHSGSTSGQVLVTRPPGYLLQVEAGELDLHCFEGLRQQAQQATSAGDLDRAAAILRQALGLWRGPALADVAGETLLRMEAARLEEWRLAALEARIQAELDLGRHAELVGELEALAAQHPLRETFCGQLMVALYRCGRQVDALSVYGAARRLLIEEFGVEPGPGLQRLQRAILAADRSLEPPTRPESSAAALAAVQRPAQATPAQLPADVAAFTGRARQLQELDRLLAPDVETTAVVISAITGTAGIGKTALALHWAHRVRDRFPDGQLYVNLRGVEPRPVDPLDTLAEFLRALGVDGPSIPPGLDERARLYRSRVADRRVLVVLDNARNESQVRSLLPGTSSCTVLVTSRASLAGLEGVASLTLDVLEPAEALALLARIAGAERVAAEPEAAASIVERCGYLPLAVRIAAARLAAKQHWRLSYLAERLASGRRLPELRVGDLDVAASIALSYQGLGQREQRAFRLLAILDAPDFPAWVAGAVLKAERRVAEEVIERLVDAHLLEIAGDDPAGGTRYRFHDLLRDFARTRLRKDHAARRAALGRALAAYLTVTERAREALEPGGLRTFCRPGIQRWQVDTENVLEAAQQRPLEWFAVERQSLLAAVEQAYSSGLWTACWQLAGTLSWLLNMRSEFDTWQRTHELALDAARRDHDRHAEASILQSLGSAVFLRDQDSVDHVIACYRQAIAIFEEVGDRLWQAYTESWLGDVWWSVGRLEEAEVLYQQTIAAFRDHGDRRWEALTLRGLGVVHRDLANLTDAQSCFSRAGAIFRDLGDAYWEGFTLNNLGDIHGLQGRLAEAITCYQESLISCRRFRDRYGEASVLIKLGDAYRRQRRFDDALAYLQQSVRTFDELGDRWWGANARRELASVYRDLGRWDDAAIHLDHCLAVAHETHDRRAMAYTRHGLGELYRAQGRTAEAIICFNACLAFFREFGFGLWVARTLRSLGAALQSTGDITGARTALHDALKVLRDSHAAEADEVARELRELSRVARAQDASRKLSN